MIENKLDLETYIQKRISEIEDLDERKFAKELLIGGLMPVLDYMEKRYSDLEERVQREMEISNDKYAVMMTVIKQENYDPINDTLFPVQPELLKTKREEGHTEVSPYIVYFSGTFQRRKEFEKTETIEGYDAEGKKQKVFIRKAGIYQNVVEELYRVFTYNQIPWTTVNTGYLDCFYELYSTDGSPVEEWEIDFGDYKEEIATDRILLWNIQRFTFRCQSFMMPCIDEKYYEHEFDLKKYDLESGYMIGKNEDILKIRHERDKIILTSYQESFRDWLAYRFVKEPDQSSRGYGCPMLGNQRKTGFFRNFRKRTPYGLGSKTEIFWIMGSFVDSSYVELWDIRVTEEEPVVYLEGNMNPFLGETLFPMETRKLLVLSFRKKNEDVNFCEDIVRFLISQMQMSFYEYKCIGILAE